MPSDSATVWVLGQNTDCRLAADRHADQEIGSGMADKPAHRPHTPAGASGTSGR